RRARISVRQQGGRTSLGCRGSEGVETDGRLLGALCHDGRSQWQGRGALACGDDSADQLSGYRRQAPRRAARTGRRKGQGGGDGGGDQDVDGARGTLSARPSNTGSGGIMTIASNRPTRRQVFAGAAGLVAAVSATPAGALAARRKA